MDHCERHDNHNACCKSESNPGLRQTLSEMEFERGIWSAAQSNDLERVKKLLNKGTSQDEVDSAGYTALHYAARNGHREVCELLLKNGASVNARTRSGRATPLHRAATQGRVNIVELLLKRGADANLQDADGCTALHRAITARSLPVCELLAARTDLMLMNNRGQTAQDLAMEIYADALSVLRKYSSEEDG